MNSIPRLVGMVAVALALGAVNAQSPENLPKIPNHHTYPIAINHSGEIIGVTYDSTALTCTAVHWLNGTVSTLPGYQSSVANAINDAGVIVGTEADGPDFVPNPVIWVNGQPSLLPTLGRGGIAYDINNAGDIVGWVNTEQMTVPALWHNGQLTILPTLADNGGEARAIDSQGVITGFSRSTDYYSQDPTQWVGKVASGLPINFDENYAHVLGITKAGAGTAAGFLVQRELLDDGGSYPLSKQTRSNCQIECVDSIPGHKSPSGQCGTESLGWWKVCQQGQVVFVGHRSVRLHRFQVHFSYNPERRGSVWR